MEIHKPKPVHSWRELLTEIGVVVIGVAIALAAEQAVEWLHWQHRVADARAAILIEVRDDNGPQAYTRAAVMACLTSNWTGSKRRSRRAAAARQSPLSSTDMRHLFAHGIPPHGTQCSPRMSRPMSLLSR